MPTNYLLKEQRDKRGWSQKEVADLIKAGEASYCRWESQGVLPQSHYRRALSRLFEKTIEELGLLPSISRQSSVILKDAGLDGKEIGEAVNANPFLQLCSIMSEESHEHRSKRYAILMEELEMNFDFASTRRKVLGDAVTALALLPFSPPLSLSLESIHMLPASKHALFLQEVGAALVACEDLSHVQKNYSLVFQTCSQYLVGLKGIMQHSTTQRAYAQELAARCAILKTNVGWHCVGNAGTISLAKEAVEIAKNSGHVELHLSALSKLSWSYLYQGEEALALSTAEAAANLLQRSNGPISICIYGGTWSTLSVMQAYNLLDPDFAMKKVGERGSPGNMSHCGMIFSEPRVLLERGIAQCASGQTGMAMQTYSQIIDPKSLMAIPAFQGSEGSGLTTILYMAEASLTGDARDMDESIRYWEYVAQHQQMSKHRKSKATSLYKAMRLAFPGEKRVSRLADLLKEKSQ
jgi:DNA-binding XRE family transcriptional regulator